MYYWVYALFGGLLFFKGIFLLARKVTLNFKFLGVFFLLTAYHLMTSYWNLSGLLRFMPHLSRTGTFLGYLGGPVLYFFLHFTFHRGSGLRPRHAVHLIPFLLHFIELIPFFLLSAEEKRFNFIAFQGENYMSIPWGYFSKGQHLMIKSALMFAYTFAGLYENWFTIQKLGKSKVRQTRLFGFWLKWTCILFLLSMCLVLVIYSFNWLWPEHADTIVSATFFISFVFCVLFFVFFPELTAWPFESSTQQIAMESLNNDIDQLSKDEISSVQFSALFTKMLEEHYSDENLDVGQMARLLHSSERNLYRKVKIIHGASPNELLNDFRIQRAYSMIRSYPFRSIATIRKESGFKSSMSFTKRFKEQFGLLPSEFQKVCRGDAPYVS